ncbi:hypothetical protein [Haliangium ochraceum]|uniref:Uncharacterized protein n=1 Tax=Haliangium ochraceum (strain DSM 14365 / JCM 11303 / SMP-2) TaxID=502025 RepID=D0LW63_HALO1|nr:hypothetical protein [Haliangium ochraceum]ACY15995.1 hypothetical protein Hoch_3493 [Haliangium ochraceum DSM 14365]
MEGIFDGRAVDTCFYCALLYPAAGADDLPGESDESDDPADHDEGDEFAAADECPICDRRMRYRPAADMSDPALREAVAGRLAAYRQAPSMPALRALLELVHDFAPASLAQLRALGGPRIEALRDAYEALA